jgi:hypothetical protein
MVTLGNFLDAFPLILHLWISIQRIHLLFLPLFSSQIIESGRSKRHQKFQLLLARRIFLSDICLKDFLSLGHIDARKINANGVTKRATTLSCVGGLGLFR